MPETPISVDNPVDFRLPPETGQGVTTGRGVQNCPDCPLYGRLPACG